MGWFAKVPIREGGTEPHGLAHGQSGGPVRLLQQPEGKELAHPAVSDHGLSLGIYIKDPDGNGIEVYYETPQEVWHRQDNLFMSGDRPQGNFPGPWEADLVPDGVPAAQSR